MGICFSFGMLYVIHPDIFPIYFLTSSYGICNFISRIIAMLGPIVAEVNDKIVPLCIVIALSFLGAVFTLFLRKNKIL